MGSDLPGPEVMVIQNKACEIRGSPDNPIFKGVGFRFTDKMDFPTTLTTLVR